MGGEPGWPVSCPPHHTRVHTRGSHTGRHVPQAPCASPACMRCTQSPGYAPNLRHLHLSPSANIAYTSTCPPVQVDIFQAPLPMAIKLVLTTPGLPQLILLTTEPSNDGISFGTLEYDQVAQAVAASQNANAKLSDGTV